MQRASNGLPLHCRDFGSVVQVPWRPCVGGAADRDCYLAAAVGSQSVRFFTEHLTVGIRQCDKSTGGAEGQPPPAMLELAP